jgi:DNA (cytosine-5)-methyltransferase 1
MIYRVLSLFSGCGGMDLGMLGGFEFQNTTYTKNPIEIVRACDIDPKAVALYNQNLPHSCNVESVLDLNENAIEDHDIMIGGFPCQSFSIVAQNPIRLGYHDDRGKLFAEMCRILKYKQPRVFVAENVKGILSANKGQAFSLITNAFSSCGYHIKYQILNASHYGIPQKRERVFIVGFREYEDMLNFQFPPPTHLNNPIMIKDILEPEHTIEQKHYFSEKAIEGLLATKHASTMNKGRVQDINAPCNTVGAHLAKVSLNSTDPVLKINGRYRMFTPREVARIQSFPENYKLVESRAVNYRGLGNAVPPVLMWHVANQLVKVLDASQIKQDTQVKSPILVS